MEMVSSIKRMMMILKPFNQYKKGHKNVVVNDKKVKVTVFDTYVEYYISANKIILNISKVLDRNGFDRKLNVFFKQNTY